mmetsp:Transcript_11078/g.51322  ORF Transcript_11078/g.51322 Transcript_11078/m.51322 type:complete len:222 (+) Transcript_11078:291-956(+)
MRGIYTTTTSPGTIPWTTTTTTTSTRTRRASTYAASDPTTKRGAPGIIRPTGIAGSRRIGSPSWRAPTTSPRARTWRSAPTRRAMTSAASAAPCPPSPSSASAARSCQRLARSAARSSGSRCYGSPGAAWRTSQAWARWCNCASCTRRSTTSPTCHHSPSWTSCRWWTWRLTGYQTRTRRTTSACAPRSTRCRWRGTRSAEGATTGTSWRVPSRAYVPWTT